MGRAKEKPLYAEQTDYEDDFFQWCFEQAELLRKRRFDEVDLPNVIEELESMGNEQRHALESAYGVLLMHLLKWAYQPDRRSTSWRVTINAQRSSIRRRESKNPALAAIANTIVAEMYGDAVVDAALETGLPTARFPRECPWSLSQLRDAAYLPDADTRPEA